MHGARILVLLVCTVSGAITAADDLRISSVHARGTEVEAMP